MLGKSVFHTVAWSGRDGTMHATFLHVYMQLQRCQPTYAKLRHALREGQTDEEIAAQYPSVAAEIIEALLLDVRTANAMDVFVDAFVCYPFADIVAEYECEEKVRNVNEKSVQPGALTEQAQNLRQDTLRRQVDDLTRVWPVLQGDHGQTKRRQQALSAQKLEGRLLEGYQTAERRGLAFLLKDYQRVLMQHYKHKTRQRQCADASLVTTGEDVDLEIRYEHMRLSPLLTDAAKTMTYQGMCAPSANGEKSTKYSHTIKAVRSMR